MIIRDALNGFNRPQWRPVTGSSRVVLPEGPVLPEGQRESSQKWDIVGRELLLADPKLNDPEDTAPLKGAAPAAAAFAPKRNEGEASPAPTPVGVASKLALSLAPLAGSTEEPAIPAFCSGSCRGSTGLCPCCSSHCSPLLFNGQAAQNMKDVVMNE